MKKLKLTLGMALALFMMPSIVTAQDGFFSNAQTLQKGAFALSVQPVFLTEQDDFMLMFRGAYGLAHGLTGHAKLGVFDDDDIYAGAHLEANIASEPSSGLSVAVLGGIYSQGEIGLKTGLNISKDLDPVSIYSGVNYQPYFLDGNTLHSVLIPVGVDIHLRNSDKVDLVLEGDIPVNNDAEYLQAITFGARFYL